MVPIVTINNLLNLINNYNGYIPNYDSYDKFITETIPKMFLTKEHVINSMDTAGRTYKNRFVFKNIKVITPTVKNN